MNQNVGKTHCKNGHEFNLENTRLSIRKETGKTRRFCRKCQLKAVMSGMAYKRKFIIEAKNKPCNDCNIKYPFYVMQFDHLNNKLFQISGNISKPLDDILKEIDKCEVVCANCHSIRTHNRRGLT